VAAAGDREDPRAQEALARICEIYWPPVYGFIRSRGHDVEAARDLTQGFFAVMLEKHYIKNANQDRGRFRSFLLVCVKRFLSDERGRELALKRGGHSVRLSLDVAPLEVGHPFEGVTMETPEQVFEKRWAITVMQRVTQRLRQEAVQAGNIERFDRLKPLLDGTDRLGYRQLAEELGMSEGALKVAVHRLRHRFGQLLRQEIAATVADPHHVAAEVRHVIEALSA